HLIRLRHPCFRARCSPIICHYPEWNPGVCEFVSIRPWNRWWHLLGLPGWAWDAYQRNDVRVGHLKVKFSMRKTLIASALTILVIIAIAGMAVAQSQTKFVDNSPTGSPIRLAETVNANGECGITALNTDKRPVVAVVVDFDAGPVAGHMTHDHFLRR